MPAKYNISSMIILLFVLLCCETRINYKAGQAVGKMSTQEKIGQMLMLGVPDNKICKETTAIITNYYPGGIILFGYNIGSTEDTRQYIKEMQQTAISNYRIPMFISIDQEGGRVRRITSGVTQFPGNMAFGVADNESLVYDSARITGMELRMIGINMNLAPAIDVNNNSLNPVINTRSFGSDSDIVSRLGAAYIKGLQKSKCIAVCKHFPGHGDTDKDSHLTLPVIHHNIERLHKVEFPPFVRAIDNNVEGVMTAHISFPEILKNNLPATISKEFLTDILRNKMHFKGIVITDDMEMNAVSKIMDLGDAAVKSVIAGTDIVLVSTYGNSIEIISGALNKAVADGIIPVDRINESVERIIKTKLRFGIMNDEEGKSKYEDYNYTKEEAEILTKSEELNRKVSRESIYFYSGSNYRKEDFINNEFSKIFISSNSFFITEVGSLADKDLKKSIKLFKTENDFINQTLKSALQNKEKKSLKNTIAYYQFDRIDNNSINKIINVCKENQIKLYFLCTGNPFPLGSIKGLPPVFFTFSSTHESIKQLVLCLNGGFEPKKSINVNMGMPDKK
ncbi:MAG: glycoside hydrolase family 3 protein [Spirochaetota bacterium]